MSSSRLSVVVCVMALVGCGGDDDDSTPAALCDAGEVSAALASASAGDEVAIGACMVHGQFTVPAGVTLRGSGADASSIMAAEGTAVTLEAGTGTTRLASLTITSSGDAAVVARGTGAGAIEIEAVRVTADLGIGIGLESVSSASLDDVSLTGPVDQSNAQDIDPPWVPDDVATVGLAAFGVGSLDLASTLITGFATAGAAVIDSTTVWVDGGVRENLGAGLYVTGGAADLTNLEITDTLAGTGLYPAYGAVFTGGAVVTTSSVHVSGTQGPGMLHDDTDASHTDLVAELNERAGVWAQNAGSFRLSGGGSRISGNGLAGILLASIDEVEIDGAEIGDTTLVPSVPDGELDPVDMGDGLLLRDATGTVALSNLTIANNGRAGILIDLGGGSSAGYTFDTVSVDGTGDQLGCIGQNGEFADGWAAGVERLGATATNDPAQVDPLGVTGIIDPQDLPPAAAELSALLQ